MVPQSLAAFYAFLGLVAPGLVFYLLRERARPAREESAFREASSVVLASLVFATLSLTVLILIGAARPSLIPDLGAWLTPGSRYVSRHYLLIARSLVVAVLMACTFAFVGHWLIQYLATHARAPGRVRSDIVKASIWYQLFDQELPADQAAWVHLRLTDNTNIWGYVDFFTVGQKLEDREISLKGPKLSIQTPDANGPSTNPYWEYVMVRGSEIRFIKVAYEPRKKAEGGHN